MLRRIIVGAGLVALVASLTTFVEATSRVSARQIRVSAPNALPSDAQTSMTLVGCLVKESDYRREHGLGKGGLFGFRTGSDFVLVNARTWTREVASSAARSRRCAESSTGNVFRLAGKREGDLKPFVGRYVQITGRFEHDHDARIAAGEEQAHLPPEVVVASYRAIAAPRRATASTTEPPSARPSSEVASAELPKTASVAPLITLIGLALFGTSVALILLRRRTA